METKTAECYLNLLQHEDIWVHHVGESYNNKLWWGAGWTPVWLVANGMGLDAQQLAEAKAKIILKKAKPGGQKQGN